MREEQTWWRSKGDDERPLQNGTCVVGERKVPIREEKRRMALEGKRAARDTLMTKESAAGGLRRKGGEVGEVVWWW